MTARPREIELVNIVAGLGNPGKTYVGTPHNVGFETLDLLAQRFDGAWRGSLKVQARTARVAPPRIGPLLLLKPQTFMNLSGNSVAAAVRYYGCDLTNVIVVFDDADLPPGRIRIRGGGGSGGHRGVASIIEALGGDRFPRIRIGIGRSEGNGLIGHVLGRMTGDTRARIETAVISAADAVECLLQDGLNAAMNRFNIREADATETAATTVENEKTRLKQNGTASTDRSAVAPEKVNDPC